MSFKDLLINVYVFMYISNVYLLLLLLLRNCISVDNRKKTI
jgi:hypothetical protein